MPGRGLSHRRATGAVIRKVEGALAEQGIAFERLRPGERDELLARWRATYRKQRLDPDMRAYDWHLFSWGAHAAETGLAARVAYRAAASEGPLYALSGWTEAPVGWRCGQGVPWLERLRVDVLVTPPSMAWTMAFTHEDDLGPYYARA